MSSPGSKLPSPAQVLIGRIFGKIAQVITSVLFAGVGASLVLVVLNWAWSATTIGRLSNMPQQSSPFVFADSLGQSLFVAASIVGSVIIYRSFDHGLRIVESALGGVAQTTGFSLEKRATLFVADWRTKYLSSRAIELLDGLHYTDLVFIKYPCFALYPTGDPSRIVVVAYGDHPTEYIGRVRSQVIWVCAYIANEGSSGLSEGAMRALGQDNFPVDSVPDCIRVAEMSRCSSGRAVAIRKALNTERVVTLCQLIQRPSQRTFE